MSPISRYVTDFPVGTLGLSIGLGPLDAHRSVVGCQGARVQGVGCRVLGVGVGRVCQGVGWQSSYVV